VPLLHFVCTHYSTYCSFLKIIVISFYFICFFNQYASFTCRTHSNCFSFLNLRVIHFHTRSQHCSYCHFVVIFFVITYSHSFVYHLLQTIYALACLYYIDKLNSLLVLVVWHLLHCLVCSIMFLYMRFSLVHAINLFLSYIYTLPLYHNTIHMLYSTRNVYRL
jgi:hypothetical protein